MKYYIMFLMLIIAVVAIVKLLQYLFVMFVDQRIANYQSDLIEKQCEEVENMYHQVRGWRHDYKHHIQKMKAHLEMQQYGELQAYLNELDVDLTKVDTIVKTGNVRIDAILNSKLAVARSREILVNTKAIVPVKLPIPEVDLCVIIGNLLDNAMEACEKETEKEQRFIRIYVDILKGQLYIYVANSMTNNIHKQGKLYLSTKQGKHGFGLMRLDKVVEKYHGYLNRQYEDKVFVTEILLPLTMK